MLSSDRFFLGGKIRAKPTDFIVEEVWENRICDINYPFLNNFRTSLNARIHKKRTYLHFTLVKSNWDTIRALNYIGGRIFCSLKRFGISGMKDKWALTSQKVSLWKEKMDTLAHLKLPDMFLKDFEYKDDRITLGNSSGNQFTITIRNIPKDDEVILRTLGSFEKEVKTKGLPNFFGPQRLGGDNAEVGRAIKNDDLKGAVEIILKKIQPFIKDGQFENIPKTFWYEKRVLQHLTAYPNDFAGALRKIPKRILRLYTHAYQSENFNDMLTTAIKDNKVPKSIIIPGFNVSKMPNLSTLHIERKSHLLAKDFKVLKIENGIVKLKFTLGSGEYASTLLSHLVVSDR